jgi:hypothetical protein
MTGPFYLAGLLHCCGVPMQTVTWRADRRYRCLSCGRGVDAISAEVEVWDRTWRTDRLLGDAFTPYQDRQFLLSSVLARVDRSTGDTAYHLSWLSALDRRPTAGASTSRGDSR